MNDDIKLLIRSFDEDLDEIDQNRLQTLLDESPTARAEHVRIEKMRLLVASSAAVGFDTDFADNVLRRISDLQESETPSEFQIWLDGFLLRLQSWRLATGLAAAVAVLVALGVVYWLQPQTVSVPYGEMRNVTLGDGTTLEMSGGSTVSYRPFWWRSERRVEFEGEAFFDVAEDRKPFIVETFNADITVLGTQFNVRSWRDDGQRQTAVAVSEGRVAVAARSPLESESTPALGLYEQSDAHAQRVAVLEPGEATVVSADSLAAPRSVSLDRVLSWRTGGLSFTDQPLQSVFKTIERRFGVDVRVADPEINERLLTYLNPRPDSAAAVLADICHTLDLRYRRVANGFEVLAEEEI